MYTSENKNIRILRIYLLAALGCAAFGAVYELFSHEVYSYYMIYSFMIPLTFGALPFSFIKKRPCTAALYSYNSGAAVLTVGCIFKGVLEIYGTTNSLSYIYLFMGMFMMLLGIIMFLITKRTEKKYEHLY